MIYLLDTNVVAELTTRPRPSPAVVACARSTPDPGRRASFERALAGIRHEYRDRIAPIGESEALAYLTIHKRLKSSGTPIDPPDALIAATALANGWTLVSRNTKHLARTEVLLINPWDCDS